MHTCAFTCVYFVGGGVGVGGGLMGQLCVCPICHPTLLTPKGMPEGVGDSFWKKESGSSGLMGNNAGSTDGPKAKDTDWVCRSQSTNLFDKTVGHPCQALPQPA